MPLYAPSPALRGRQLAADVGLLAWLVLWVLVARTVHGAVLALAEPGRAVEELGASVAGSMSSAAQDAVGTLATVLAVVLVLLPVGWALLRWLTWRLGWARAAGAARRLAVADPDVLAARALATAPLSRLAALPPGTADGWRAGDPAATRTLAAVELERLGLPAPRDG